ncbi:RDD family protein [Promethearchaeum syntrophicum]|uniref:RDD family protein n=1 Tax=Promethearchaeum syntrophicum TaxID=2594042 RepID=A0A5B9DD92_9ARCH|nr:RDD family protein [Candidatus Prometheoarchaeum syntrophicum]QEE17094.1 RDD family protein [Candidatus Prometheoarchaeum syntrophicum]
MYPKKKISRNLSKDQNKNLIIIGLDIILISDQYYLIMSVQHFCPQCGNKNNLNSEFCESCGLELFSFKHVDDKNPESKVNLDNSDLHSIGSKPLKYADDGDRFVAYIIDGILFSVIGSLFGLIFGISWNFDLVSSMWNSSWPVIGVSFLYLFLLENLNHGQTIGKMILKIQTVDEKTLGKITPRQAALHTLGKLFLPLDIIIGLISRDKAVSQMEKNQVRFSQKFSHTSVVSLK